MAKKFDLSSRMTQITESELLEGLRRYAAVVGWRAFGVHEFNRWRKRPFGASTAARRFGSWAEALERIGVKGVRRRDIRPEDLVANLEKVWEEMGRRPGARGLTRMGKYHSNTYKSRWGSVRRACEQLAKYHDGLISWDELLRGDPGAKRLPVQLYVRWNVLKRDRYRCTACGKSPATDPLVQLHVDHIKAVSLGGGNEEGNLRTLCSECNVGKGATW